MPSNLYVDFPYNGASMRGEPLRMNNFEVEFPSLGGAGDGVTLAVTTCTLPNMTVAPIDIYHGNDRVKIAGEVDWAAMTLEFRDTLEPDVSRLMWEWLRRVFDPGTRVIGFASDYKENATVIQYTVKGEVCREWDCQGVWPTGWTPGSLDYASKDPVIESVEFSIDRAIPSFPKSGFELG